MLEEAVAFEYGMSWETSAEALASTRAFLPSEVPFRCDWQTQVLLDLNLDQDQEAQGPSKVSQSLKT